MASNDEHVTCMTSLYTVLGLGFFLPHTRCIFYLSKEFYILPTRIEVQQKWKVESLWVVTGNNFTSSIIRFFVEDNSSKPCPLSCYKNMTHTNTSCYYPKSLSNLISCTIKETRHAITTQTHKTCRISSKTSVYFLVPPQSRHWLNKNK